MKVVAVAQACPHRINIGNRDYPLLPEQSRVEYYFVLSPRFRFQFLSHVWAVKKITLVRGFEFFTYSLANSLSVDSLSGLTRQRKCPATKLKLKQQQQQHENEDTVTKTKIYDMATSYTYDRFCVFSSVYKIFIYLSLDFAYL